MHKKLPGLSLLLLFVATFAFAQDDALKVNYYVNPNRNVELSYEKADPGTYTVVLDFTTLVNSSGSERRILTASGRAGRLETLTPTNKDQSITFSYKYSYIRGKLKPKINNDIIYVLPYRKGAKTKAYESTFVNATYFGNTTPDDWKAYHFYTDTEDTIAAVRKGTVVNIKDTYDTDKPNEVAYKSSLNEIMIEHGDGTLATYRGFKKGSFKVSVGQVVFPGMALGLNSKYTESRPYAVYLIITYLKSADLEGARGQSLATTKSLYGLITPNFYIDQNPKGAVLRSGQQYEVESTPEIVTKEMTKREIKQLPK